MRILDLFPLYFYFAKILVNIDFRGLSQQILSFCANQATSGLPAEGARSIEFFVRL